MLKTLTTFVLVIGLTFTLNAQIQSPAPSPSSKIEQAIGLTNVTLEYSRPAARGRTIFGDLVPYGAVWRTGANARTKITFSTDVSIDGKELKAGTYAIFTIPSASSWDIVFYTDSNGGGAPAELDETKVALKTTSQAGEMPFPIESFTMLFGDLADPNSGTLNILWANTYVSIKIDVPTDAITLASIESTLAGPSDNDYYNAGMYYFNSGKDLAKAKKLVDKGIADDTNAFWQLRQQSLIYAASGDKKGAIAIAKKSLELATTAGNADYIKMNNESIAEWSK